MPKTQIEVRVDGFVDVIVEDPDPSKAWAAVGLYISASSSKSGGRWAAEDSGKEFSGPVVWTDPRPAASLTEEVLRGVYGDQFTGYEHDYVVKDGMAHRITNVLDADEAEKYARGVPS